MRPTVALSILIGLATQAVALDEWRQSSFTYMEIEDADVPVLVENRGTTPILLNPAAGSISRMRYIVGAAQQNPPTWHAKFTPLQQNMGDQTWNHEFTMVPAGMGFTVEVWWIESRGEQEFELYQSGQPTGLKIDRQRLWNDPMPPQPIRRYLFELAAPPGGGLPPGGG